MKLFTKAQLAKLIANGAISKEENAGTREYDEHRQPVVKWFTPFAGATWLISEFDPDDNDMAFGLADLGLGSPELGYVYIPELLALRGPMGLGVERDLHWEPTMSLTQYADQARSDGRIAA